MNHTERIAETARRHRHLNRRLVKEAVETYLELLAEEMAQGDWVDIYGIGRIQVIVETGSGSLRIKGSSTSLTLKRRLRTKLRLFEAFKEKRYKQDSL
ncbi:MAG: hypothetical protein F9K28_07570 [Bacteroidetes bacterium]|nr:MAG: hypothetical protein F9K28_07570 [Bacteroidota bacterium]